MIRLAMAGAAGRMGRAILNAALKDSEFQISAALESASHPDLGKDLGVVLGREALGVKLRSDIEEALNGTRVLIDFTHPTVTTKLVDIAEKMGIALVIGTTGLDSDLLKKIHHAAKTIPIVQSPNMSVGVNLLFRLCELAGKALDESYDIEIAEIHHRMKKDAPSGTAAKILQILTQVRGKDIRKDVVSGRDGEVGARKRGEIGVFALRGGDVIGDHTVSFLGDGERVELSHKASSRDAFALGALKAAKYLAPLKSGLYNMQDVLGI